MKSKAAAQLAEAVLKQRTAILHLQAHCAALETAVLTVARNAGMSEENLRQGIADVRAGVLQTLFEQIESADSALAAYLDDRKQAPDLPDELI